MGMGCHFPEAAAMTQDDSLARGAIITGRTLAIGSLRGLWSLEALDRPPRREADIQSISALNPAPHRNLAREWIAANPKEWDIMLRESLENEQQDPH